jgi:hypothetical protein
LSKQKKNPNPKSPSKTRPNGQKVPLINFEKLKEKAAPFDKGVSKIKQAENLKN